jgi:hypothetical protein
LAPFSISFNNWYAVGLVFCRRVLDEAIASAAKVAAAVQRAAFRSCCWAK